MAISYRIDSRKGLVLTTATGVLTEDELLEHKRKLLEDPAFKPGMRELSDVRGVEKLEVTPEGVWRLAAQDSIDSSRLGEYRLAIVASTDIVFGTARMYEALTDLNIPGVMVFRDMEEARSWLGVNPVE